MYQSSIHQKRITINIPSQILKEAQKATGKNMTETIITALESLKRFQAYNLAMKMKGKIKLKVDLEKSRERNR